MSATGNAAGNATCNGSVNTSVSAADKRAQQEEQEKEGAAPPPAVIVHPEHEDADLIPSQDEYYNLMRMTNAEQHQLLREIIHRQTTPSAPPLRVFYTGPAGCGKTFVLRLAMDLYNRYSNTGNNTAYNASVICASTGKAAVAVGGTTVHAAFKLSRKITGPNKDGGLSASELNSFRVAFRNVKCVIIDEADCNVLVVDWSGLAATTYNNGAANTAAVGRELALVIQRLFKMFPGTLNPTLVHAIGYSFGAQVSGFFGRNLRRSTRALIARITALDPAGPLFNNTDVSVSSEDAAFVDVIHTSGGYPNQPWQLGLFRPVGHVDFYPNGAKNQPGCLGSTSTSHGLILTAADAVPQERKSHLKPETALCDHMRAPELFLESLVNKGCRLESQPCPGGFEAFLKNSCGGRAEGGANNGEMGFFSLRAPGRGIQLISTNAGPRGYYCIKKSKQ
ncbi:hepatic triacylglycerol lipase-like isoform X2 [Haemaphysalis longicornis]